MKKAKDILLIMLLALSMLTSVNNSSIVEATCTLNLYSTTLTGDKATDIVNIGLSNYGRNGSSVGATESWCADFVWRCADLAGISTAVIPHTGSVVDLYNGVISGGGTVVSSAKAGDLVFYYGSDNKYGHVGIMTDSINSVQGNLAPPNAIVDMYQNIVWKGPYTNVSLRFACFVRPNYYTHTHAWSAWTITKAATCTQDGQKMRTCSCGHYEMNTIPATGHSYGSWITTTDATCTVAGTKTRTCSKCSHKETQSIPALGHLFSNDCDESCNRAGCGYTRSVSHKYVGSDWVTSDKLPSAVTSTDYEIQYNNKYKKNATSSPGSGWVKGSTTTTKYVNSGSPYESRGIPLATSQTRVLLGYSYYHFCGASMGNTANFTQGGQFMHYDSISDATSVTVYKSGADPDDSRYTYYYLKWNDGNWAFCSSGTTCDGSYGTHGARSYVWYRVYRYQDKVAQTYYTWTKESGWTSTLDSSASSVQYRYRLKNADIKKASTTEDGGISLKCSGCGLISTTNTIPRIDADSISLEKTSYEYDGKACQPKVIVKDRTGATLEETSDYTLEYNNNIDVGTASVKIVFCGNYTGEVTKTFNIVMGEITTIVKVSEGVTGGYIYFDTETGTITDCDEEVTAVEIPNIIKGVTVTTIGDEAFCGCTRLKNVIIPNSVTLIIWEYTIDTGMVSKTITHSVTTIGDMSFYGCTGLESITIPNSVTTIGEDAFENCSDDLVLYGYDGSTAESYANTHGLKFVPIDTDASLSGLVTGYNGNEEIRITAVEIGNETNTREVVADKDTYLITDLESGTYNVTVSCNGCASRSYTIDVLGDTTQDVCIYQIGDVDMNGEIAAADVTRMARHIAKIQKIDDEYCHKLMDTDKSGEVEAADVTHLARYIAKLINTL